MAAGFFLRHVLEVCSATVQGVVVEEDRGHALDWLCDLPVQIEQAILPVYLSVPDGVACLVLLAAVAPFEIRKKWVVLVVNESDLILREWNSLHVEPPC
jgi:hypothetical protein